MNKPNDTNEPSLASAGSHGDQCRCGLATRLVGDGCEHCNPAMMIDILREQVAEMRLTDEEREAIAGAMWDYGQYADELGLSVAEVTERQATLRGLLDRTK
jgi:hypothetical protein